MKADDPRWRKIIRRDTTWKERSSQKGRRYSWSATYRHTLTLECGHMQTRTGHTDPPKHRVLCKDCEAGYSRVSVEGIEHGVFDRTRNEKPKGAAVVEAIMDNERERMEEAAR